MSEESILFALLPLEQSRPLFWCVVSAKTEPEAEQHGAGVIEKVRKERPQDYLKVAASLLPKQMETETRRTRPLAELSDAELIELLAGEIEVVVERVLISRGHAQLTIAERQQSQNREQECSG